MQQDQRPRTAPRASMPPRGKTPGLKRGRHGLPYWIARQVRRDTMNFPENCIPLPPGADMEMLSRLCFEHSARLDDWIAQQQADAPALDRYDGSVVSASRLYQSHRHSPFHAVKHNTRKSYVDSLKIIEATVGQRLIRNLTVLDVRNWYNQWRRPTAEGGRERIDRAHDAVCMFRTVLRFCAALRYPDCKQLAEELTLVKFERGGARTEEMTSGYVGAFIKKALEMGQRGVIPADRARCMAIGVAAQFDLAVRQKDIIGDWGGPYGQKWTGFFTWENIPGWRWRMRTSKSKYRASAEFDLANYGLLFPLLEAVPHDERQGAIVKGEHGEPVRERSYRNWFRQIARAAGIPDAVWNMDSRAGAATEADEAGADLDAISAALTHNESRTTVRYIRRRNAKIAGVAEARARKRAADEGGTA
jgi:Phage integrase family